MKLEEFFPYTNIFGTGKTAWILGLERIKHFYLYESIPRDFEKARKIRSALEVVVLNNIEDYTSIENLLDEIEYTKDLEKSAKM